MNIETKYIEDIINNDNTNIDDMIFAKCVEINNLLNDGREPEAQEKLAELLYIHKIKGKELSELENHLLRQAGLYQYMGNQNLSFQDKYVKELFKTNVGEKEPAILHREQSRLLKLLLEGKNIAVSATTSFGKSFVIDAFISIKKPQNVVIIVPTIALMDETRRRLNRKFANEYEIITTTDGELRDRNILIFPQERALIYFSKLKEIDILIIDEFYKSSIKIDKERAPKLLNCILKYSQIAKQKYYLAPNIDKLDQNNPFTQNMQFEKIDFNTVFLSINDWSEKAPKNKQEKEIFEKRKFTKVKEILETQNHKTLIYTSSPNEIKKLQSLFIKNGAIKGNFSNCQSFAEWLKKNYLPDWQLAKVVKYGIGVHHGKLHRSISQIVLNLFEKDNGIHTIISTSSIIEGVNTCAENIILWNNTKSNKKIDYFTYKNIIGRSGRMFKHFIGNVILLEKPPQPEITQLELPLPVDNLFDEKDIRYGAISAEDKEKIASNRKQLIDILGKEEFDSISDKLQNLNKDYITKIAKDIKENPRKWSRLDNLELIGFPKNKEILLDKLLNLFGYTNERYNYKLKQYFKICSRNWSVPLPKILRELSLKHISIEDYFDFEKFFTYDFSSFLSDFNLIQKQILKLQQYDIEKFVKKLTNAFMPQVVYQLEEFGLPRMISQKIRGERLINFDDISMTMQKTLEKFNEIGCDRIKSIQTLDYFDKYIIDYFFAGIRKE